MIYTPLYIKTDYSLLESLIKIDDLIMFSKENNIKSLGICDDNLCGVIEFYNKCHKNNIKPIIGINIKVDGNTIILYAKNYNGYTHLIHLLSLKEERELNYNDLSNKESTLFNLKTSLNNEELEQVMAFNEVFDPRNIENANIAEFTGATGIIIFICDKN